MTGSDDVFGAALRRYGVLRVQSIADLFYMSEVLSKQPKIKRIVADENSAIRHLTKHGGATVTRNSDATYFRIQLAL
jgi:acetyltransferase